MRSNSKSSSSRKSPRNSKRIIHEAIEVLESRCLMSATGETVSTIPAVLATPSNASSNSITLDKYFTNADMPGTLVTFHTTVGTIEVSLTDAATPLTVANFLSYVDSGAYNGTIFHRSALLTGSGDPSPATPADIIQGGGDIVSNGAITHITTKAAVDDEYTSELFGDVAGTLAMAKTSDANSATSEWYFNENDNSSALDTPTTDSNGVTTSYTVFGTVISGLKVIKQIASLPVYNYSTSITTMPVSGLTQAQATAKKPITANNLIYVNSITSKPGVTYTVTSDNPGLVTPTLTDGVLSFAYASGQSGTADITVKATSLDGTSATTTFPVTVPDSAEPTQGPVAAAVTATAVSGVQSTVNVLGTATDSVSSLPISGVSIVTEPTNGSATVDATTGAIDYTSTSGFTGTDTLTYTVTDSEGAISSAATVTLNVVAAPVTVTIGTNTARSLTFTQPDGSVGKLKVSGGTALVTFSSSVVTTNTSGGVVTASGTGATIASVVITNTRGQIASLDLASSAAVTLGSVNDTGLMSSIIAPTATMTGTCNLGSLNDLDVAALTGVSLDIGKHYTAPQLLVGTATNSSVTASALGLVKSKQWLNTDGGSYFINAASVNQLIVTSSFADTLTLTGTGQDYALAKVGQAAAAWNLAGSALNTTVTSPASTWSLTTAGKISQLNVKGTLSSAIAAPSIGTVSVAGAVSSASIAADLGSTVADNKIGSVKITGAVTSSTILSGNTIGSVSAASLSSANIYTGAAFTTGTTTVVTSGVTFSKKVVQLGRLSVGGAATGSVIYSAGNTGTISAGTLDATRIYAGITLATAQAGGALASAASDVTNDASIAVVKIGKTASSFSNSQINADILGTLRLGDIATSNNGTAEGVAADKITAIVATLDNKTKLNLGPAQFKASKTLTATQVLNAFLVKKKIIATGTTTNTVNDFSIDLY